MFGPMTANVATTSPQSAELTLDKLLEIKRQFDAIPRVPEIRVSEHAVQRLQARVYPKRKAKNDAHLRRMNNKWIRRYGFALKPAAYVMDTSLLGEGRGKIMFVHPALYEIARRAVNGQ
jgi:hypothetical protein